MSSPLKSNPIITPIRSKPNAATELDGVIQPPSFQVAVEERIEDE
jgi:hypothetical protein